MDRYFTQLNYTLGDEDSAVEHHLLPSGARRIAAVAGSGGRVLPLLAKQPAEVDCIDILDVQLHLARLRIESIRAFGLDEFTAFWGYPPAPMPPEEREKRFRRLPLPPDAAAALGALFAHHGWSEIIYMGRFEATMRTLSQINGFFTGAPGRALFDCDTVEEQTAYLEKAFPRLRWSAVLALLANATVLNGLLYKGEFPKRNIPRSTYANFRDIYDRLFRTIPLKRSFFAQLTFFGRLATREAGLLEIDPATFAAIKEALAATRVNFVRDDIVATVGRARLAYDFVSLSDVPSFLPEAAAERYLQTMRPGLAPGALVVARGNLRVIRPEESGFERLDAADLIRRETTQLWHIDVFRRAA